jgi:hypothetical protein
VLAGSGASADASPGTTRRARNRRFVRKVRRITAVSPARARQQQVPPVRDHPHREPLRDVLGPS